MRYYLISALFFLSLAPKKSLAEDSARNYFPRAVLVQLNTEKNRKEYLSNRNRIKELQEVTADAKRVMEVTIKDFTDHYNGCPVYYFADTNISAVIEKKFEGVLLNADMTAAKNIVLNTNSSNYVIVYFGYPKAQKRTEPKTSEVIGENSNQRMVILNSNYKQITYLKRSSMEWSNRAIRKSEYAYISKHFDILYLPFASRLYHYMGSSR